MGNDDQGCLLGFDEGCDVVEAVLDADWLWATLVGGATRLVCEEHVRKKRGAIHTAQQEEPGKRGNDIS